MAPALKPAYRGKVSYAADAFAAMKIMAGDIASAPKKAARKKVPGPVALPVSSDLPPAPAPFSGVRTLHWSLEEMLPWLDRRVLVRSRWRMREGAKADQFFAEIRALLENEKITAFSGVYGYFDCRRRGKNSLELSAGGEDLVFNFPRRKRMSLADYFAEDGDMVPLFIVSCGKEISLLEKKLFASDQYSRYLLLHGFGVQLAESLAAKMHQHIRQELGLDAAAGKRFSPGYPAWPELADQSKLVRLLQADSIGVSLSENVHCCPN